MTSTDDNIDALIIAGRHDVDGGLASIYTACVKLFHTLPSAQERSSVSLFLGASSLFPAAYITAQNRSVSILEVWLTLKSSRFGLGAFKQIYLYQIVQLQ